MSGCRNGGRDVYQSPDVRDYDQTRPIRGRLVFADGTDKPVTMARYVNGVERVVSRVEVDGIAYMPEGWASSAVPLIGALWCCLEGRCGSCPLLADDDCRSVRIPELIRDAGIEVAR